MSPQLTTTCGCSLTRRSCAMLAGGLPVLPLSGASPSGVLYFPSCADSAFDCPGSSTTWPGGKPAINWSDSCNYTLCKVACWRTVGQHGHWLAAVEDTVATMDLAVIVLNRHGGTCPRRRFHARRVQVTALNYELHVRTHGTTSGQRHPPTPVQHFMPMIANQYSMSCQ